jgi:hypothetical protein
MINVPGEILVTIRQIVKPLAGVHAGGFTIKMSSKERWIYRTIVLQIGCREKRFEPKNMAFL